VAGRAENARQYKGAHRTRVLLGMVHSRPARPAHPCLAWAFERLGAPPRCLRPTARSADPPRRLQESIATGQDGASRRKRRDPSQV